MNLKNMANFDSFVLHLTKKTGHLNPDAQQLMAPFIIGDRNKILTQNPNPRLSAVIILIYEKDDAPYFVLIERPIYEGVHSGQIAFPGGKKDPTDSNLKETALRELFEEVGISSTHIHVIGEITPVYIPPSKFLVTPFVGVLDGIPQFKKDDYEVKSIIEVPISLLFNDAIIKTGNVPVGNNNMKINAPYFDIFGFKVWGATAIILSEFKAIMKYE